MLDAKALFDEIRDELQPVNEHLLLHPYVRTLAEGKIEQEKLRVFAGEQYAIIGSELRSVAHLVSRFGGSASRESVSVLARSGPRLPDGQRRHKREIRIVRGEVSESLGEDRELIAFGNLLDYRGIKTLEQTL